MGMICGRIKGASELVQMCKVLLGLLVELAHERRIARMLLEDIDDLFTTLVWTRLVRAHRTISPAGRPDRPVAPWTQPPGSLGSFLQEPADST